MTIIAWDGKTLAADKQMNSNGHKQTTTKIFRINGCLIGTCGSAAHGAAMQDWFREGADHSRFPEPHKADDYANMMCISENGEIREYEGCAKGHFDIIEDKFSAMGCGRNYALGVMHLGYDAVTAVQVASALDVGCGMGIDKLTLEK